MNDDIASLRRILKTCRTVAVVGLMLVAPALARFAVSAERVTLVVEEDDEVDIA